MRKSAASASPTTSASSAASAPAAAARQQWRAIENQHGDDSRSQDKEKSRMHRITALSPD
jgi:hypothetical protein